jgi:hypothetical protein
MIGAYNRRAGVGKFHRRIWREVARDWRAL